MKTILAIITFENGVLTDTASELAATGRQLSGGDGQVSALVPGNQLGGAAKQLSTMFDEVVVVDDPRLANPDGDLYANVVAPLITGVSPDAVLMSHTNFAMDMVPRLSVKLGYPLMTDCLSIDTSGDVLRAVRSMYAGRVHATVEVALDTKGCILTVRPGVFDARNGAGAVEGRIRTETMPVEPVSKRRFVATVAAGAGDVDISQAEVLVAVGRGIEDGDNMEIIERLAESLGAEIACSRPVVDSGWLPKTRQVGTSGVMVRPKIYLAVGISGSFQHMGGVKGDPFIVAINSDRRAPIFGEADVGIVGDLFDIVPLLTQRIQAARS